MQKKAIPFLIAIMILALSGIIIIQYLWIQKSIREKQALIDNNVIQATNNLDLKLSDYGAMAFFSAADSFNVALHDSLIFIENFDTAIRHVIPHESLFFKSHADLEHRALTSLPHAHDCILVAHTQILDHQQKTDSIRIELSQMENELMRLEEVRTVFDHIRLEMNPISGDFRLDSTRIDRLLKQELMAFQLDTLITWGVYDNLEQAFVIQPKSDVEFNYTVPLFKKDIIQPGRYQLKLNLNNNANLIWVDIRLMIILSVIFILILVLVFLFALRLVLKHKKISQIKSDFINNMTHEFKTPLASISLAADSIVHPTIISDKTKIENYVAIIQQEKHKLNQHVERILEVASLEKDVIVLPVEAVNLKEIVEQTAENLKLHLEHAGGKIDLNLANLTINGSAFHLTQALSNIIENSIKYSTEKPQITVSLTEQNKLALLQISDQGIGMTEKQLSKVFDSFYRAETGNIHTTKGFGLGLTYARFVISKMGGRIAIQSQFEKGTTVTIQFPCL